MSLIDPNDSLERQNEKLLKIADSLMRRVEYGSSQSGAAYAQFERAALLEKRVRERTLELERTLDLLHDANAQLARANQETEAARRNLADAIETISEGFALFDPNDDLVMCNSRFCRDFRDTANDLKPGLAFDSYVDRVSKSAYLQMPDHQDRETWAELRRQHHKDRRVMFNVQLTHDRWLQVSEHRTANGGTVVLQTDITDIMRIERQEQAKLRDKQTRMIRATLDHLNQGVCIFDENAQLVGWNQKLGSLLSIPARRLRIGASFTGLLDDLDDSFEFTRGIDRDTFRRWANEDGLRQPVSFEVQRGDSIVLHIFGRSMPDRGFVISCTDVTAEREAAQKLYELNEILEQRVMERTLELEDALSAAERANASKSRFVAAASHDLLQPLSAAKLFMASLSDKIETPNERAVLAKAETALGAAEQIIDALLNISKLESDGLSFDIRPVALREIFDPLRDEMEMLAEKKGLTLRIVDSSLVVESDPAYLRRIVQNLLTNAIRYTNSGRVVVGARRSGESARIEVWDTGPGIAEEDQNSIFEEFRRLDAKASNNDGLGLGLAIVERACARLGHPLGLWSELGRGSCFMLNVPLARQTHTHTPVKSRNTSTMSLLKSGLIVLLVENDPQLRRAMSILIESWGISVIESENAESALELMEDLQITPDALLLDYQLGDGASGTELYEELTRRLGRLPCAIVSAERSAQLRHETKRLGAELLLKPLDRTKLIEFLHTAARQIAG
ncbi:PAS-domain containing protein [Marivita sp. XM-24bin2]|jgi:signal transduction histidine kinase|uniref:hybrid sensor histidine kinase/response regulator n=1 Tax=unclassified Marivita TaxID=2632480 RepID=UPI000D7A5BC6|nr:PAS-domain containing protein [Marivita sp. XM-24bin2]MCR9107955.1 PAS-domain containing protein [Paracoccaceae bacterium]PWL35064.1 MAG: hybrid sensor histidine kinase/response regulator [Marivita sp. XM-24bin2]